MSTKRVLRNRIIDSGLMPLGPRIFKMTETELLDVLEGRKMYEMPKEDDSMVRKLKSLPWWAVAKASKVLYELDGKDPYPGQPEVNVRYPLAAGRKLELTIRIAEALIEAREMGK